MTLSEDILLSGMEIFETVTVFVNAQMGFALHADNKGEFFAGWVFASTSSGPLGR